LFKRCQDLIVSGNVGNKTSRYISSDGVLMVFFFFFALSFFLLHFDGPLGNLQMVDGGQETEATAHGSSNFALTWVVFA